MMRFENEAGRWPSNVGRRLARVVLVMLAILGAVGRPARATQGDAVGGASDTTGTLAATSAVPWNPPRILHGKETWEQVVNAPLTVASLPVQLVGAGVGSGLLRIQEDLWIPRLQLLLAIDPPFGVVLRPASLGPRTGTGGAIGFEPPAARGWLRASLDGSTLKYNRGRVEVGPRWLAASYTNDWRPQEPFFGLGMESEKGDASNYSLRGRRAELNLALRQGTTFRRELGAWVGERRVVVRRGRESGRPSLEEIFPATAAATFDQDEDHVVLGARAALDTRGGHPHWSHGWRLGAQVEQYGHPRGGEGVLFPGAAESPAFSRTTLEGETGVSFMRDPRTLRLSARVVDTRAADPSQPPPFHDLAELGGSLGLPGYEPGRFRDMDLAVAKLAYLFPIAHYAEMELATQLGGVFGDVWQDARLDRMRESYGVALRLRTDSAPIASFGFDWGREQVRFRFGIGGVE